MALPTNISYGTVVAQFLLAYADGPDADPNPDGIPAKGTLYFQPSPIKLLDGTATPNPVTILPANVECALDVDGYLLGTDGTRGVTLVATDDTDLNPVNWTWKVDFRLTDASDVPVSLPSFSFSLPSTTEVDLTTLSPVADSNGTYYLVGPAGPANALAVGTVTTLGPGVNATVAITGTSPSQTIDFGIPEGEGATIAVGSVSTLSPGTSVTIANSGTSSDAVFDFGIPQGAAATVAAGGTTTVANGTPAAVANSGTTAAAVFDFTIPAGPQGIQGPIGNTGATGLNWQGTWSSSTDYVNNDAVFYSVSSWFAAGDPPVGDIPSASSSYWHPLALQGSQGIQGVAATIAVGTVTTGSAGTSAIISNTGTSGVAVFDFTIPKGDTGSLGALVAASPITYNSGTSTIGLDQSSLVIDGGTA